MAFALGGRIIDFSVLPSSGRMGNVDVVGGSPEWLWVAAPYLCDVLTFVIGYIWASKIQPARRWLFINIVVVLLLSPLVNSAYNYRGIGAANDVGYLAAKLGPKPVHIFFISALILYAAGIARIIRRQDVGLS